jgi:hypothetical protein
MDPEPHEFIKLVTHVNRSKASSMKKLRSPFPIKSKAEWWNIRNCDLKNEGENWNKK